MEAAEKVLRELEQIALKNQLPIIGPAKAEVIKYIVKEKKPSNILEIGTLIGYSAILIADAMPENGKLVTIEINDITADVAKENIRKAGLESKIEVIVGDAKGIIQNLGESFDLVFLDAVKEEYLTYLKKAEPKMQEDSIVIADNVKIFENEMLDFLDYIKNSGKYETKIIEAETFTGNKVIDAISVSVKK